MTYTPPLADFALILDHILPTGALWGQGPFADVDRDSAGAVLAEAGRLCRDELASIGAGFDQDPARMENGRLVLPAGFERGWRFLAENGWVGMATDPDYGGMGLPMVLTTSVMEMASAVALPLTVQLALTQGAMEALTAHGTDAQKQAYLPLLAAGQVSGTMNLTEPQAGSDLAALTSRARPEGDHFVIDAKKIYISAGDAPFLENVVHLVLARLPDAPDGVGGISLFLVPRMLPGGGANAVQVLSTEHKLGLHGSATCTMSYDGATGWLIGAPHKGLAAMFTMMNNARLSVGAQGVGLAQTAYEKALAYAAERQQGKVLSNTGDTILYHADIRRRLGMMRARLLVARTLCLDCALALDMARVDPKGDAAARAAVLTPLAKAFGTDCGVRLADEAIQIHGGMGYIEETGVARIWRDARITPIYEGTNAIQAMDLVGRKLDQHQPWFDTLADDISQSGRGTALHTPCETAAKALRTATMAMRDQPMDDRFAGAQPFLDAMAMALGMGYLARASRADHAAGRLGQLWAERALPQIQAGFAEAVCGAKTLHDLTDDDLSLS